MVVSFRGRIPSGDRRRRGVSKLEGREHLVMNGADLRANAFHALERPAAAARGVENVVDAGEDRLQLRVHLDDRARAHLARVPLAKRVGAELAALEEKLLDLVLVTA